MPIDSDQIQAFSTESKLQIQILNPEQESKQISDIDEDLSHHLDL